MKNIKIETKPDFAKIEKEVLKFWEENKIFEKSLENHEKDFVFYDGPPFANGLPHYGHILTGYVKDTIARFKTMRGFRVERRFGWDCHGLPAEMAAEKELGVSGKKSIEEFGIEKFNNHCRTSVMKFADKWREYVNRQGRWVDMENDYKTMDRDFMESTMWVFKTLFDRGLIYESERVMPYSWACETPLSNFETRLDNSYREKSSKSVFVKVKLKDFSDLIKNNPEIYNLYAVIWTTTPWTLPSNLAIAVEKDITYQVLQDKYNNNHYIVAKSKKQLIIKMIENCIETSLEISGWQLLDLKYEPLFPYFKNHKNAFRILNGDFVSDSDGTGMVHIAPGFGEDDFILCKKEGISSVCPVDSAGRFTAQVPDFEGRNVLEANDDAIIALKRMGLWLKTEQYLHKYPFCWRTDTPLIYRTISSWYVKVTDIVKNLVTANQEIYWLPEHIKDGQFGKWLEDVRDWSISRNRFWGTPLPIWKSDNPAFPRVDVYGSIEELERDFQCKVDDLHRPYIDNLTRPNPDDPSEKSQMVRIPDVFDCWFESGSMPYGQLHYPFENKEKMEQNFPADFIVEYLAQTRGWFYTLHVLATALFDRPAFKNCICHGVILDANGSKLSKRLGNYVDPLQVMDEFGSDALRFAMLSSTVVSGGNLHVHKDSRDVKEAIKMIVKPFWNTFYFLHTYAQANKLTLSEDVSENKLLAMDKFILYEMNVLLKNLVEKLDKDYILDVACKNLVDFLEKVNNWYIRCSKKRFWNNENVQDLQNVHNVLYIVLKNFAQIAAPFLPFLSEFIFKNLCDAESVHLQIFEKQSAWDKYENVAKQMNEVMEICSGALAIRNTCQVPVRQPLQSLKIVSNQELVLERSAEMQEIAKDELNVKNIEFILSEDFANFVLQEPKINFPVVAKKMPKKIKQITQFLRDKSYKIKGSILQIADENLIVGDDFEMILKPKDDSVNNIFYIEKLQTVLILHVELNEELILEGLSRNITRFLQESRKNAGINITEEVDFLIEFDSDKIKKVIEIYKQDMQKVAFARSISFNNTVEEFDFIQTFTLDKQQIVVKLRKI